MNFQDASIAFGIDTAIYTGTLRWLLASGFPGDVPIAADRTVLFDDVEMAFTDNPVPLVFMRYQGRVVAGEQGTSFIVTAVLHPTVVRIPPEDDAVSPGPQVGFDLGQVAVISDSFVDEIEAIMATALTEIVPRLTLPIFDDVIDKLVSAAFPTGSPLPLEDWPAAFVVAAPGTTQRFDIGNVAGSTEPEIREVTDLETVSALHATLALPGNSAEFGEALSIVPRGSGLHLGYARSAMDLLYAARAATQIGQDIDGANIDQLSLTMNEFGIGVEGRASKDAAVVRWEGTVITKWKRFDRTAIEINAIPGGGRTSVYSGNIQTDIDLPWYVGFLRVFLFVVGPAGWIINSILLAPEIDEQTADVPDLVQDSVGMEISNGFAAMFNNLGGLGNGSIPSRMLGQDMWVDGGALIFNFILLAGRNSTELESHTLDLFRTLHAQGSSVGLLKFASGHVLAPTEAGSLMKDGLLEAPGLHGVEAPYGFYVRTNPNETVDDNLVDPDHIVVF